MDNTLTLPDNGVATLGKQELATLHPCVIYRFLLEKSPEACLQLLPLLSDEQFTRLFDYDVWHGDRLSPQAALHWLNLYRHISAQELLQRFRSLDEEYQLAIMSPLISLIKLEELETLDPQTQDRYQPLPCRQLYYTVKSPHSDVRDAVIAIIETLLTQDLEWTYTLLIHANSCLATEQEMLMLQFRTARMEEDGFISLHESGKIFVPINLTAYRQRWQNTTTDNTPPLSTAQTTDWFSQVLRHTHSQQLYDDVVRERVQLKLLFCSNTLCAATSTNPSDRRGVRQMLQQTQALIGLSLDYLSDNNLNHSATILAAEHSYVLFRVGMTLIYQVQEELLVTLHRVKLPRVDVFARLYGMRKWQALHDFIDVHWLEVLGYERVEVVKGIFARFPQLLNKESRARFITVTSMLHYRQLQQHTQLLAAGLEKQQ